MTGRDQRRAAAPEVIHHRDAERSAFDRVGSRAHFVEQHQRGRDERPIHRRDVHDVAGEGAQARVNRLLVADIGKQRPKHRQARSLGSRNAKPRLGHQREQAGGLQRDRLAAGVRTGDQQHRRRWDDFERHRHRRLAVGGRADTGNQQRVACRLKLEGAVGRQRGLDPVHRLGEPRTRLQHIELRRHVNRARQIGGPQSERIGQGQKDPPDLFGFLFFDSDDVVVDFDRAQRLEKEARPAGRGAVHDARDAGAVLGLHHEHVPPVPLHDDLILQVFRRVLAAQVRLERRPQPRTLFPQPIPQHLQLRTRIVHDVAGRIDLRADL